MLNKAGQHWFNRDLALVRCVTLGKLLDFSGSHFPHLKRMLPELCDVMNKSYGKPAFKIRCLSSLKQSP